MSIETQIPVTFILPGGEHRMVSGVAGSSLMQAAVKHDIPGIIAECGGACACATCHVVVDERDAAKLDPASEFENEMLDSAASDRQAHSRLACQIRLRPELAGLRVVVPGVA